MDKAKSGWQAGRYRDGGLSGVVGILGQPNTGKTYLAQKLIRSARRAVFFDTVCQVGTVAGTPLPGFRRFTQPGQLVDFWRKHRSGSFRILYQPGFHAEDHFDAIARLVIEVRNVVFCVDEVWHFCKPSWMPEPLRFMARAGRHRGITLLYTAQRPAIVARDLTSVSTQLRVFRLVEKLDIDALRGRLPADALARVPSLPNRVHVARDEFGNWQICK